MTDDIKDIFKEFKARTHSPLFGSFIIAWLCVNWYIPVVLIFYSQADVHLDGHKSLADAIINHISIWYNAVLPLISLYVTPSDTHVSELILRNLR